MKMALFFTRSISLKTWLESGLLEREKLIYEKHLDNNICDEILWFTYGCDDDRIAEELYKNNKLDPRIKIIPCPSWVSFNKVFPFIYSVTMPFIFSKLLKTIDIMKSNQLDGAQSAFIASLITRKPFYLRSGFLPFQLHHYENRLSKFQIRYYQCLEQWLAHRADYISVSNQDDYQFIKTTHNKVSGLSILPNFIDTSLFKPELCNIESDRILFIGRFTAQKNLYHLIESCSIANNSLTLVGSGEQINELKHYAEKLRVDIDFVNQIPNNQLPRIFNQFKYFILPSLYEGMPKALLEAMACGLVCIGTNVRGINEVIQDGINGYLSPGTDPESIAQTIERAMSSDNQNIRKNAVSTIHDSFSLEHVARLETEIFRQLLNQSKAKKSG